MKILQIANKAIFPPDGGSLAILSIAKAYIKNGYKVHLLNMITQKHTNKIDVIENEYKESLILTGVKINTKISYFKLIINFIFSRKPYISQRFISKDFKNELNHILKNNSFDFIQLEGLYVLQYIKSIREIYNGKVIYRSHNIESLIWERNFKETTSFFKKVYFKSMFKRLRKIEKKLLNTYDYLLPISNSDEKIYTELGNSKPVLTSPFGIDLKKIEKSYIENRSDSKQFINYIGALDWIPNQEGLLWFIDDCFPIILKTFPDIILKVAGRNAPIWLIKKLKQQNIQYQGELSNAYQFIQTPGPMIVPLFAGSGMRVKIIEGMALKKAIVATSIAAEGINCTNNKNIILANNPKDYANSVISLLDKPETQMNIGQNAYELVKKHFNFEKIGTDILIFIK